MFCPRWVRLFSAVSLATCVAASSLVHASAPTNKVSSRVSGQTTDLSYLAEPIPADLLDAYLQNRQSPADPRGACNTAYNSSALGTRFISGVPGELIELLDDIELASSGRELCSIEATVYAAPAATLPYTVTCNIYNDCPATEGEPGPGTLLATANATVSAGGIQTVTFNFPSRPTLPDARPGVPSCDETIDFWIGIFVNGANPNDNAGPVLRSCTPPTPEVGCSADLFGTVHSPVMGGEDPDGCNYILSETPCANPADPMLATFVLRILTAGGAVQGACCDLLTGQCSTSTADNCAGQLQQFFAGQSCPIPGGQCTACGNVNPTGTSENEPNCSAGYDDMTNSGCNSTPPTFGTIACGQTINGTSGTFLIGVDESRDTDWFRLTLASPTPVSLFAEAEFNFNAGIYFDPNNDCNFETLVEESAGSGSPCSPLSLDAVNLNAGTYYVVIAPADFTGVQCGRQYNLRVNCGGSTGQGACCTGEVCQTATSTTCAAAGGTYRGDGSTCSPNPCSTPSGCLTCPGDTDGNGTVHAADAASLAQALAAGSGTCADVNDDGSINGADIAEFVSLAMAGGGAGTPCGGASEGVVRCDQNGTCPDGPGAFCWYAASSTPVEGQTPCVGGGRPLAAGEAICIACPGGNCGTAGDVNAFAWPEQNCSFNATLLSPACNLCGDLGAQKRFRSAP